MKSCPTCQRTFGDDIEFCPHDATPLVTQVTGTEAQLSAGLARRFRIVRRLGAGGMGTVFLAEQIGVGNRPVALKVLNRRLLDAPEFLMRFQNEAASTGRIHHPNVVMIHESGQADDGTPYIAMEFLEGQSLREVLKERGALPAAECAEILQQAARGLNAAHKLGIIHRDLKPDNIFLTQADEGEHLVKVVDFGIAKLRESAAHTQTGMVLGTPAYMSSDQASGMRSDELDARSDVYSLGVVAYEMLTGRVPFHSDTPLGFVGKHMMDPPPSFRAAAPGLTVPPAVEAAVMKALAKDREQRYASALEFAREFSRAVADTAQELSTTRKIVNPEVAERVRGGSGEASGSVVHVSSTPSKAPYIFAAAILLFVIAGAIWYFWESSQRIESPREAQKPIASIAAGMVAIPGGTFTMGRDNAPDAEETPAHSVNVAPFDVDKEPVTQAAYSKFLQRAQGIAPNFDPSQASWPATNVSWQDAEAYCRDALTAGRLPSEAEWEFVARGTDGRLYPWGNTFSPAPGNGSGFTIGNPDGTPFSSSLVNSSEAGLNHPEPVGAHTDAASPFGVLDMSGNVWEWCFDDYKPYPGHTSPFEIPGDAKVIRGGSFKSDREHVTTTARNLDHASTRSPVIGFRCAKSQ